MELSLIFIGKKKTGLSVIELMITLSLCIIIGMIASNLVSRLKNGQKKATSTEGAKVESLEFFNLARKVIYTNLFTKHSPNSQLSFEQKVKKDDEDP